MKSVCIKYLFFLIWIQKLSVVTLNAEFDEDSWNGFNDWSRDHLVSDVFQSSNGQCCQCSGVNHVSSEQTIREQPEVNAEDVASSLYFKKFVKILFNRKHFEFDSTKQQYTRPVVLTIDSHQMEKLERLQDPRDLDNILIEVFNNMQTLSRDCDGPQLFHVKRASTAITTIVYNILYDFLQLFKTSEMQFLLGVVIVILVAWLINTRFKIGWLLMIVVGVFAFGYLHTYIECNRELEVTKLLEILNTEKNTGKGMGIMSFFKGDDVEAKQQRKLKQSAKLSLGFCRPDHVLLLYFNDLFIKYLKVLIEQCTEAISSLSEGYGFPFNFLKPVMLVCLVGYMMKLTFKYMLNPSAWTKISFRNRSYHEEQKAVKSNLSSEEDRISGDNLKLLLNAISAAPVRNLVVKSDQNPANMSGVEDVKEAIEEGNSEKSVSKLGENKSEKSQSNNNTYRKADEEMDVKIEDLRQES